MADDSESYSTFKGKYTAKIIYHLHGEHIKSSWELTINEFGKISGIGNAGAFNSETRIEGQLNSNGKKLIINLEENLFGVKRYSKFEKLPIASVDGLNEGKWSFNSNIDICRANILEPASLELKLKLKE